FIPPTPGIYMVRIKDAAYEETVQRVELVSTSKQYVTIDLKPIPGSAPAATAKDASGATVSAADLAVPDNAKKEFDSAQTSLDAKDYDSGIAHLKRAIDMYGNFPQAYATLGAAYLEQKKFTEAQTSLQKAVELDPKAAGAYIELGAVRNQLKDYPGAVTALSK